MAGSPVDRRVAEAVGQVQVGRDAAVPAIAVRRSA